MELALREKLLVEKCLNSIIRTYNFAKDEDVNALIDLKLDFLSFLTSNQPEEVQYGIEYLKLQYEDIYLLLGGMILEYQQNKLEGALHCKPIPGTTTETVPVVIEVKSTIWDKIQLWFNSLFKKEEKGEVIWEEPTVEMIEKKLKEKKWI